MTDEPLVWLPFDPERLGELPDELRYEQIDPDHLPESADEVEFYVLAYRFRPEDGEALATLPKLRVVQTLTAGVEHIRGYVPEGVLLCNGRGIHDTSTAELALALILASLRGIPEFVRAQERAEWAPEHRPSLADKQVLIVGLRPDRRGDRGEGAAVRGRGHPGRAAVPGTAYTPSRSCPTCCREADVVVLIVPGTDETTGLFDAPMLARIKDDALLVNVSRGPVVDTDALLAELESRRIHAALDVVDPEPLPGGPPALAGAQPAAGAARRRQQHARWGRARTGWSASSSSASPRASRSRT